MAEQGFEPTLCDIKVSPCCVAFLADYSGMWEGKCPLWCVSGVVCGAEKELERRGGRKIEERGAFPRSLLCYLE